MTCQGRMVQRFTVLDYLRISQDCRAVCAWSFLATPRIGGTALVGNMSVKYITSKVYFRTTSNIFKI